MLSLEITNNCKNLDIVLQVQWVQRELNTDADLISREVDLDDWGVSQEFVILIDSTTYILTILNFKLLKFKSKYWCPNTSRVDAFSVLWEGEKK